MFDLITRKDRGEIFGSLPDLMNRVFDLTESVRPLGASLAFVPPVDVYETEKEIRLRAECPGLDKESLSVVVESGVLTITGEKKEEEGHKDANWYRAERRWGRFSRSFTLPAKVESDKISATYQDGILEVVLPKAKEAQPQKIPVKVK
jgi:HSP20 family protein